MTGGTGLLNQEKIRTLKETETYKYLGVLEVDTIKQVEMKKKKKSKNSIPGERENYAKPNYVAEISSKERRNKTVNVGDVVIDMKRSIIY